MSWRYRWDFNFLWLCVNGTSNLRWFLVHMRPFLRSIYEIKFQYVDWVCAACSCWYMCDERAWHISCRHTPGLPGNSWGWRVLPGRQDKGMFVGRSSLPQQQPGVGGGWQQPLSFKAARPSWQPTTRRPTNPPAFASTRVQPQA